MGWREKRRLRKRHSRLQSEREYLLSMADYFSQSGNTSKAKEKRQEADVIGQQIRRIENTLNSNKGV